MGVSFDAGGSCHRATVTFLALCLIISGCFTTTTDSSGGIFDNNEEFSKSDFSMSDFSISQSKSSLPYTDRLPCVFRADLKLHLEIWKIGTCFECICINGSTSCNIITCQRPQCPEPVEIPGECCSHCPFNFELFAVSLRLPSGHPRNILQAGAINKYTFDADVEISKEKTSRRITGENLWQISAWVSRNHRGTGKKFSYTPNILKQKLRDREFRINNTEHYNRDEGKYFSFSNMKYAFDASEGLCEDFKYLCIEFSITDNPVPIHNLNLTYSVYRGEAERQISCVWLGACRAHITAVELDWDLQEIDQARYGQNTNVRLDVNISFTPKSANIQGEGLWRIALFGSGNVDGSGPRFQERHQLLNEGHQATSKNGTSVAINNIHRQFELGTIGCTEDVQYVCVEFAQGNDPDPHFIMAINSPTNTLIKCKEQECTAHLRESSINLTTFSKIDGLVRVKAVWTYQIEPEGFAVQKQMIHVKKLDMDNCSLTESDNPFAVSTDIKPSRRGYVIRKLNANSLVNVSVTVVTLTGQELEIWKVTRTAKSAPSGRPRIMDPVSLGEKMWKFTWTALECGKRNGDVINYEYVIQSGGRSWALSVDGLESVPIGPLSHGERYTIRVRAHSEKGFSKYKKKTGIF